MDPSLIPVIGFAAVAVVGGVIMAAVSFFSMKETSYESLIEKHKQVLEISDQIKVVKQKREHQKKKSETRKKKDPFEKVKKSNVVKSQSTNIVSVLKKVEDTSLNKSCENVSKMKTSKTISNTKEQSMKHKDVEVKKEVNHSEVTKSKVLQSLPATSLSSTTAATVEKKSVKKAPIKTISVESNKEEKKTFIKGGNKTTIEGKKEKDAKSPNTQKGKVKSTSKEKESVVEMVQSSTLDDATIFMLMDVLKEKSHQGQWTAADGGSRKGQVAELQRQLQQAVAESKRYSEDLLHNQLKLRKLMQEHELFKQKHKKVVSDFEQTRKNNVTLKREMDLQLDEKQKQIIVLQSQAQIPSDESPLKKLKDENELLHCTIQSNIAKYNKQEQELKMMQTRLEDSLQWKKRCTELEMQIADYQRRAQLQVDADSQHIEELKRKIVSADVNYQKLESEYQKVQNEFQIAQGESAKLIGQMALLSNANDQHSAMEKQISETKQELEQRLVELAANDTKQAEDMAKLHTKNKDLLKCVEELESQNQILVQKLVQEQTSTTKASENMQKSSEKLHEKDSTITSLNTELSEVKEENSKLSTLLEELKHKNDILRERNWKAMDAIAATEKTSEEKIAAVQAEADCAMKALRCSVEAELYNAFPSITVTEKDFNEWLHEFLQNAQHSASLNQVEVQKKNEELLQQNKKLIQKLEENETTSNVLQQSLDVAMKQNKLLEKDVGDLIVQSKHNVAEAQKYKSILASTEGILETLQSSVEHEEHQKAKENVKDHESLEDLKQQLESKSILLRDMELECINLRKELKNVQEVQAHTSSKNNTNKEDQGFVIVDEQSSSLAVGQESEVTKLKERLEKEKDLTKNLGEAAKKLQALLKQTQDELNKERQKNKNSDGLQEELND